MIVKLTMHHANRVWSGILIFIPLPLYLIFISCPLPPLYKVWMSGWWIQATIYSSCQPHTWHHILVYNTLGSQVLEHAHSGLASLLNSHLPAFLAICSRRNKTFPDEAGHLYYSPLHWGFYHPHTSTSLFSGCWNIDDNLVGQLTNFTPLLGKNNKYQRRNFLYTQQPSLLCLAVWRGNGRVAFYHLPTDSSEMLTPPLLTLQARRVYVHGRHGRHGREKDQGDADCVIAPILLTISASKPSHTHTQIQEDTHTHTNTGRHTRTHTQVREHYIELPAYTSAFQVLHKMKVYIFV